MTATLKRLVQNDLQRAQRLMVRVGDEIDPQFRIAAPGGDIHIAMTLGEAADRRERLALLSDFMAAVHSPGFVVAAELKEPDAVFAAGFMPGERLGMISLVERKPLRFGKAEWVTPEDLGPDLPALLPGGKRHLNEARLAELEDWFGPGGKFPAVRIHTGELFRLGSVQERERLRRGAFGGN